jgi:hypothetical protein
MAASRKILTGRRIAAALNKKAYTIERWRRLGIIPYLKLGYRSIRYDLEAVEAVLLRREIKARGKR